MASHTLVDSEKYKGYTVEIHYDEDGSFANPRDCENLGWIIAWHRRYNLSDRVRPDDGPEGDKGRSDYSPSDFSKWADENENVVAKLAVYMMDHSGVSLSVRDYGDPWDSGQVGFIYTTREKVLEWYQVKRITKETMGKVIDQLAAEVKVYGQWVNGEVYGYVVKDPNGEVIDSCWGYVGDDREYAMQCGKDHVDWHVQNQAKEEAMARTYMAL